MPIVIGHDPNPGALLDLQYQMGLQEQFNNQQSRDLRAIQEAGQINNQNNELAEKQREFDATQQSNQAARADNQQYENTKLGIEAAQAQARAPGASNPTTQAALAQVEQLHNNGTLDDNAYAAAKLNLMSGKRVLSGSDTTAGERADTQQQRAQQAMQTAAAAAMNREIAQGHMSASDEVKAAQAEQKAAIPYTPEWYTAGQKVQAAYAKLAGVADSVKAKYQPQSTQPAGSAPAAAGAGANGSAGAAPMPGAAAGPPGPQVNGGAQAAPALKPIPRSMISQFISQSGNDPNAAKQAAQAAGYDPNNVIPG